MFAAGLQTYLHGLFDSGELTEKLATDLCRQKGLHPECFEPRSRREYAELQYDKLADTVRASLQMDTIYQILNRESGGNES